MPAKNKANEIRITRVYDAPVKAVWDAWTDPEQVAQFDVFTEHPYLSRRKKLAIACVRWLAFPLLP